MLKHHHEIEIVYRLIDQLHSNPHNARTHSARQIGKLANAIKAFGFVSPVIVDQYNVVLAGHGRLAAAKKLGLSDVPTVCLDGLSEAEKRAYVIADNKIAEGAGWNRELLIQELEGLAIVLPEVDLDVTITGFEAAEIDSLDADLGKPDPGDDVPPKLGSVVTRAGEVWQLGPHRVICGDARSEEDLNKVLPPSASANVVVADPPYNVRIAGHVQGRGRVRHDEFAFASGEMDEAEFRAFLQASLGNAARRSESGSIHYVFMDWRHFALLVAAADTIYPAMLNTCVWNKTNAGQGSFYRSQHELVGVFRVGNKPHQNNVQLGRFGRNRSNVWTYPGVNSFGEGRAEALASHPTVKPIALIIDLLRDCSTKGDLVLDPFLGSGTTLLAAERIGRVCCAIEYDPSYVDVAVRRWQAATKLEAVLEGDGRTFAELQVERTPTQCHEGKSATRADEAAAGGQLLDKPVSCTLVASAGGER